MGSAKAVARESLLRTTTAAQTLIRSSLLRLYLPSALCFLVINVTNVTILQFLSRHGLLYGRDPSQAANFDKTIRFFLVPAKSLVFFICTAIILAPVARVLVRNVRMFFRRQDLVKSLWSMACCLILTATVFPLSFGRQYARISTDPFNQDVGQLYRRLLIPGLANLYHLDGFFYTFVFWAIVLLAALVAKFYFLSKGVELSIVQEVSLLTTGIFAASFQTPGYPEIAVLLLGLLALMEFEKDGLFDTRQLAAFSLALMAHEACAVIVFAPMILFLFGRKSWLPSAAVALLYLVAVLANFSFNIFTPFHLQITVSDIPAHVYFWRAPVHILAGAAFAFKLLWVFVIIAIFRLLQDNRRSACFVLAGLVLASASTYIAVDYSRLVGFATIPMMVCFVQAKRRLPIRLFNAVVAINILIPSFFVGGNVGLLTFRGLYYTAYKLLCKLPAPMLG